MEFDLPTLRSEPFLGWKSAPAFSSESIAGFLFWGQGKEWMTRLLTASQAKRGGISKQKRKEKGRERTSCAANHTTERITSIGYLTARSKKA